MGAYEQGWRLIPAGKTLPGETINATSEEAAWKRGDVWFNVHTGATTKIDPDAPVGQGTVTGSIQAGAPTGSDPFASLQNQPTGGTNVATVQGAWPTGEFAASFPAAAWQSAFGLPSLGQNPFQKWLQGQSGPAYASWLGQQLAPGSTPGEFNPASSFGGNMGQNALRTLQGMFGQSPDIQTNWVSEIGGNDALSNLLQSALGGGGRGYASPIANIMANRVPELNRGWQAQTQAGATGGSFLDYLRQKFGL